MAQAMQHPWLNDGYDMNSYLRNYSKFIVAQKICLQPKSNDDIDQYLLHEVNNKLRATDGFEYLLKSVNNIEEIIVRYLNKSVSRNYFERKLGPNA